MRTATCHFQTTKPRWSPVLLPGLAPRSSSACARKACRYMPWPAAPTSSRRSPPRPAALPGMVERDCGHIINISSIAAAYNFGGNSTYHATKAAVSMLSRQLRIDAFGKRVRVTEICPGRVATDIFAHVHGDSEETHKRFVEGFELPLAKDIADAIAFAIAAPIAVNIGHMEITPTLQVPGGLSTARPQDYQG